MDIKELKFNEYPYLLRQIKRPPKSIYMAGAPIPEDQYKFLCVIGARKYTQYGKEVCRYLISKLKDYPIIIVSGLAIGIDSIAHEIAIENNMKTISVPGSGLREDSIYPYSHLSLAQKIIKTGNTLISPFKPEQKSAIWTFPIRNIIMAGLCHATLIIEGKENSGTLITAKHALSFNREVLIVPGSIFSETSCGPHLLYKEGATPITNPKEILTALGLEVARSDLTTIRQDLSDQEKKIIDILRFSPCNISTLLEKSSIPINKLNIAISKLELLNLIKENNGSIGLIP